jgi:membrane fusion protein, multidrug efflux system
MSEHPHNFLVEQQIPVTTVAPRFGGQIGTEIEAREHPAKLRQLVSTVTPAEILPPVPEAKPGRFRQLLLVGASVLALTGGVYFGWDYWTAGRFHISTDDAYVKADNTTIAPKVSGYLSEVLVGDNEQVKSGQVLARIDDRDFQVAVDQAKADVEVAKAAIANKQALLTAQGSIIEAGRATIEVDRANLTFAEQEDKRYSQLASTGYGSIQNAQQAASRRVATGASVARDTASLESAKSQLDVLKAELAQAQATLAHDEALLRQAELNLSYTSIVSPADGVVGNRTLRVGQYVQAGTALMAVVPTAAVYIIANYKETQLTNVRPGQPAAVEVDSFPGVTFKGHVDSIAPASGQEFALLPPDNATGNFTKVVQRIPVKITLDSGTALAEALRPGMSVIPTIDTKQQELRTASASDRRG